MFRCTRQLSPLALVVLIVLPACGSSAAPGAASTGCKTNTDCGSGLSCIGFATFTDAGCTESTKACSKTCTSDTDCTSLGAKYKCFSSCPGSPKFCGATP